MTASTFNEAGSATRAPNRTLSVVRMQLINKQTYIWIPLIVLAGAFALALAVYAILANAGVDGPKYGGGAQAPLWYFLAVGVQALTLTFPFSQAMSVTRREFYLGTLLTAALTSAILAGIAVVGGLIERATDGWGVNGWFFGLPWIWEAGPLGAVLVNFVAAMLFFVIGFWAATIYKRFGALWLTIVLVGIGMLLVAGMWLVGRLNAWVEVFSWFATVGVVGLSLWGAVLTAVLAGIAFLTLRRAIP
ncbi:hypothetical protein NQ152_04155 [Microbacterium sp. zg.B48]|uniref:hypothetical protein n=1 Tax=unclassified Microbacterium TaxID=2609290 RepID=UPI00214B0F0F|nr:MULTISPECIES: hypothetical protein [unclassified Microbacterium]MCR2762698.1 hypothetical protein [Microbacterium sp. zg.B48]MCR2808255.1 hypothetical protein [Microbacterium sp. zg.B185]WIM19289.1 hypothetical protein QNO12_00270 [Microbacterium sp. zg-B185]